MKKILSLFLTIILTLTLAMPLTVSAAAKPAKVKISSVSAVSSTAIKVKWKKVSSIDGYEIYQKSGNGEYKKVKTITSAKTTTYTKKSLTTAKKYTYKVRAFDKVGSKKVYGAYSATKSTYTKFSTAKITSLSAKENSVKLSWKKLSGASGYEIYCKAENGSYKKVKTITSGKTTSYTNTKLEPGKKYTYKIKAYKKNGSKKVYGDYSATKSVKTKYVPLNTSAWVARGTSNKTKISFSLFFGEDSYYIYHSVNAGDADGFEYTQKSDTIKITDGSGNKLTLKRTANDTLKLVSADAKFDGMGNLVKPGAIFKLNNPIEINSKYFLAKVTDTTAKEKKQWKSNCQASPTKQLIVYYINFMGEEDGEIVEFGTYINDKGTLQSKPLNYKGEKYYADWGGRGNGIKYAYTDSDTLVLDTFAGKIIKLKILSKDTLKVISSNDEWFKKGDILTFDKELSKFFKNF